MRVARQEKRSPEEMLEEAKMMIGRTGNPITARYPVEYEPISRYCRMVDDTNPLFLDPEFARKTKWGGVFMPPLAAFLFQLSMWPPLPPDEHMIMPPTPGQTLINIATEVEAVRPALVGDMLTATVKLTDVYIKKIALDPKAFWITHEVSITNQRGELVWVVRNTVLVHRTPDEVTAEAG